MKLEVKAIPMQRHVLMSVNNRAVASIYHSEIALYDPKDGETVIISHEQFALIAEAFEHYQNGDIPE